MGIAPGAHTNEVRPSPPLRLIKVLGVIWAFIGSANCRSRATITTSQNQIAHLIFLSLPLQKSIFHRYRCLGSSCSCNHLMLAQLTQSECKSRRNAVLGLRLDATNVGADCWPEKNGTLPLNFCFLPLPVSSSI